MVRRLRGLREPYRILCVFALGVVFGVAFDALVDIILAPHRIEWARNVTHTVSIVAGTLLWLRLSHRPKDPNT